MGVKIPITKQNTILMTIFSLPKITPNTLKVQKKNLRFGVDRLP